MAIQQLDLCTTHAEHLPADLARSLVRIKRGIAARSDGWAAEEPWRVWNAVARARACAVHASLKQDAVLAGPSALLLHGIPQWSANPDVVVRTSARYVGTELPPVTIAGMRVPAVRARQTRVPIDSDPVQLEGLPVDSLENTAMLMALSAHPLEAFVAACGIIRRLTRFDRFSIRDSRIRERRVRALLLERLDATGCRRGKKKAWEVLTLADPACENPAEAALLWALLTVSPYPVRSQHEIVVDGVRYFADFAIVELKLIIEFDGMEKMGNDAAEFRRARRDLMLRQKRLEDAGWRILRVQWSDFRDFERLRTRVAETMGLAPIAPNAIGKRLYKPVPDTVNGPQRRFQ